MSHQKVKYSAEKLKRIRKKPPKTSEKDKTAVSHPTQSNNIQQTINATASNLQQTIGNQAVGRLLIQPTLTLGPVGDKYEQEADAVAKQVVGHLATSAQPATQRQEDEELQLKPITAVQRQEDEEMQLKSETAVQRQEDEEMQLKSETVVQREEDEEMQLKPITAVQRQEDEEMQLKSETAVQRQEDEEMQMKPETAVQRQEDEEMQLKSETAVQRQEDEEMQLKPETAVQREEDEEMQLKPITAVQRQEDEEMQMKPETAVQRQEDEEMQLKPITAVQRQEDEEMQLKSETAVQRQEDEEMQLKPETAVQRQSNGGGEISADIEQSIQSAKGSGQPLADTVRTPMENAFGSDFSGINIHNNSQSNTLNHSLQARAFTTGQDIFFRSGEYNPTSTAGQELLAHELTHTIQQTDGRKVIQREVVDIPGTSEKLDIPDGVSQVKKVRMAHEAKAIINFISKEYGIDIDSGFGVESIKKDYVDVPDPVKDNLETSNWNMKELKALKDALSYYAPILGANRESSTYGGTQGVTTMSKVKQAIDEDSPLGALDNTTLGEKFSTRNISLFDIIRNSESDFPAVNGDNSKNISGTIIHELSHALIEDKVLANFVAALDYWEDEDTHKSKADSMANNYEAPITQYGKTNAAEDLAETMMYYFKELNTLENGKGGKATGEHGNPCPERKLFVDGVIAGWTP